MGVETLTTWTCDRCGTQVVTDSADTEPTDWQVFEAGLHDVVLCVDCWEDFGAFMRNEQTTVPYAPPA